MTLLNSSYTTKPPRGAWPGAGYRFSEKGHLHVCAAIVHDSMNMAGSSALPGKSDVPAFRRHCSRTSDLSDLLELKQFPPGVVSGVSAFQVDPKPNVLRSLMETGKTAKKRAWRAEIVKHLCTIHAVPPSVPDIYCGSGQHPQRRR